MRPEGARKLDSRNLTLISKPINYTHLYSGSHYLLVCKEFIHSLLQVLQLVSRGGGQRGQVLHDGAQGRGEAAAARRLLLLRALLRPLPPRRLQEEQVSRFINVYVASLG